jgi:hypothetical protein
LGTTKWIGNQLAEICCSATSHSHDDVRHRIKILRAALLSAAALAPAAEEILLDVPRARAFRPRRRHEVHIRTPWLDDK